MNNWRSLLLVGVAACTAATVRAQSTSAIDSFGEVNRYAQERSVKIYGAGGLQQLEAYQSGVLVSAEGHVATVASVVLDQDAVTVLLGSGQRLRGDVVGVDPLMDVALLKLDAEELNLPFFPMSSPSSPPYEGMQVLAFSNLYNVATGDEPVSVLHGVVTAIAPLAARRGAYATRYRGNVYVVDAATNNPGAAGGLLLDYQGQPIGMIGKEVRSELTGTWLNYALPWDQVAASIERIKSGELGTALDPTAVVPERPVTFASLGFRLVPSVVPRTPPYVDMVTPDSPAAGAGVAPDDLVIAIAGVRTGTHNDVRDTLAYLPIEEPVRITLLRGSSLIEVELTPTLEEP